MLVFPNCKVNLGLNILRKRNDGFHDLESFFYPVYIKDALEIISSKNVNGQTHFSTSGLVINGNEKDNLCIQAFELLKTHFSKISSVQIHLHKTIPMGAGLGGGSADAAFTLKILNQLFGLHLSTEQLMELALQLGSDCPFFLKNKPCFATGRGDVLEEIELNLSAYKMVIIYPEIHINTAWAFSQIHPAIPKKSIRDIIQQPLDTWKTILTNDFEQPVFHHHPELKKIKENLYSLGAIYASMSGSGSTLFGIFKKDFSIDTSIFPKHYFVSALDCQH